MQAGAGCRSSGFGDQTRGEDWCGLRGNSLKGLESGAAVPEGVRRGSLGHLRGQAPLCEQCTRRGEGRDPLLQPFSLSELSACRIPLTQAPGVVPSYRPCPLGFRSHCEPPRSRCKLLSLPPTPPDYRSSLEPPRLPSHALGVHVSCHHRREPQDQPLHLHTLYQGDNSQHMLR